MSSIHYKRARMHPPCQYPILITGYLGDMNAAIRTLVLSGCLILPGAPLNWAQGISPDGAREKARFDAVTQAVENAGYTYPNVVAVSPGADGLFVLLATRQEAGVLIVATEPNRATGAPLEIERDKTPADIGVRGIQFELFAGMPGLIDVVVRHEPFRLEQSYTFDLHHVLRVPERTGAVLTSACDFNGSSKSSVAKGPRSVTSSRIVTVETAPGATLLFDVKTVEETNELAATDPATRIRSQQTTRYELPSSGVCRMVSH